MNFELDEEQTALFELAGQIFGGVVDSDRVAEIEATDERFDRELWNELAKAGLVGVAVSEVNGGLGFGVTEAALIAQQQGRVVAPIPLWSTITGASTIEVAGSEQQQRRWLPGVCDGSTVISVCLAEYGANDPHTSSVRATRDGDRWALSGSKPAVGAAGVADAFIVPATTDDGLAVFVVPADSDGLEISLEETTNRELHATVHFDLTLDDDALLGSVADGVSIVDRTVQTALIMQAAISLGCCEAALEMAAAYTSEREQFGRPLSTNQGVVLRAASCYIDIECMRVTLQKAAWLLDEGKPAADAVKVARYWASEAAQEVVHNTQHLHGGMGADVDYPVHRTFLWVKQLETAMGGGSRHLAELGAAIAADAKQHSNA
jgi:alkylation response protein AidB-like acyl-CoA dehydrogenase